MNIKGAARLNSNPERVWAALHDAALLKDCVPGCETLDWLDDSTLEAELKLRAAGLSHQYSSRVHIRDTVPLQSYSLLFGHCAETAGVTSRVRLVPDGEGTRIDYEVEIRLDNALAKLGGGIVEKIARKMAARFFKSLDKNLSNQGQS